MYGYESLIKILKPMVITIATSCVTTIITTSIIDYKKRFKKIKIFTKKWECKTSVENSIGEITRIKAASLDTKDMFIMCELEIFNGSEINKVMRNIQIEILGKSSLKHNSIISLTPLDDDNKVLRGGILLERSEVDVINIEPRKCIKKILYFDLNKDIDKVKNINKVYISYINEKSRKERQFIKENIIEWLN